MQLDDPELKLAICLPITSYEIPTAFFASFIAIDKPPRYNLIFPSVPVGEHSESMAAIRNDLVKQAIEKRCTHISMLDTDQRYPTDVLSRLLSHDLPVVYAKVHRRYPPFDPILLRKDTNVDKYFDIPYSEWKENKKNNQLQEVDAIGGACSLFQTEVFFNIKYPWYRVIPGNERRRRMGEDIFLCTQKLKKAGYSIFVDLNIDVGHFTHMEADEDLYELFMQYCIDRDKKRMLKKLESEGDDI